MRVVGFILGLLCIVGSLQDGFESVILPRKVSRNFRLSKIFYTSTWKIWSAWGRRMRPGNRREYYLGYFGPLSLIFLLITWAILLVIGFALLQWGSGAPLTSPEKHATIGTYFYLSGVTFITLGFGDVAPLGGLGRFLAVLEAGVGFGFLALVIGYVPVIYQAFSRRETDIALLDARAGSPPSASELLRRHWRDQRADDLVAYLQGWEVWSAQILESHLSYPTLLYYRSQHERQSWLAALTTILDTCALLIVGLEGVSIPSARFTFAIARHAAVDLAQVFGAPPARSTPTRLSSAEFARLRASLAEVGLHLQHEEDAEQRLAETRRIYEPFVEALADRLLVNLPPWIPATKTVDDWQTSAWDHFAQWSPTRIEEITHFIVVHKKKAPLQQGAHVHPHDHDLHEVQASKQDVS